MSACLSAGTDRSEDLKQAWWSYRGEEYNLAELVGKSVVCSREGTGPDRRTCKIHVRATPDNNFYEVHSEVITGQYPYFDPRPIHRQRRYYQARAGAAPMQEHQLQTGLWQAPSISHAGELEAEPTSTFSALPLLEDVIRTTQAMCEAFSEHNTELGGRVIPQFEETLEQLKECSVPLDELKLRQVQGQIRHKIICLGLETAGKSTFINQLLWWWSTWVSGDGMPSSSEEPQDRFAMVEFGKSEEESRSEAAALRAAALQQLFGYGHVPEDEILRRGLRETEEQHRSRVIGNQCDELNEVGKQGLAPAKAGDEPCTGPPVEYIGCPGLEEGEVTLVGMSPEEAHALEIKLYSKLRSFPAASSADHDYVHTMEDAVLAEYKALMGLPRTFDKQAVLESHRVLPIWTRDFLGKATTFKTQSPKRLLEFLAANTTGDNAPWALWLSVQVKVPSLKPFSVVDVPGLNYQSPYQFGITQSFLESAETDLVVLLLPCGTRKTPAMDNFTSLKNCPTFFSRLIDPASTITLRTVRCLTRDNSIGLNGAVRKLHRTNDVEQAVAHAVQLIQKSEDTRPSWKMWLLGQLQNHVRGLKDMPPEELVDRLQNLREDRFPASAVDITDSVLGEHAFKDREELNSYRIKHLADMLLDAQLEKERRHSASDHLEVLRVALRVLNIAHAAINVEAMQSGADYPEAAKRLKTLAARARTLQHQIGDAPWENLTDDRTRAAPGSTGTGRNFSDSLRVANTLQQYAIRAAESCNAAECLRLWEEFNPPFKKIPNLQVRYMTDRSRTLNDHLLSEVLSFPYTPLPQIIAKDVVLSLPGTLKAAGLHWFTEAARSLERHFLDRGMHLLEQAKVDHSDGLSAILMSAQLELAQRMHHHVRSIIGHVRLAFERLAGVEMVLKEKMAPSLESIKVRGSNNTERTQLLLKGAADIAKEVALELATSIMQEMNTQRDKLRCHMRDEMDRMIRILDTGELPSVTEQLSYIHTTCGNAVLTLAPLLTGHEHALREAMGREEAELVNWILDIARGAQGRDVYTVLKVPKDKLEATPAPEQLEVQLPDIHQAKRRKQETRPRQETNGRVCSMADCGRPAMKRGPRTNTTWLFDRFHGVPCLYHRNLVKRAIFKNQLSIIAGLEETQL